MGFGITPESSKGTASFTRKVMEAGLHLGICYQIVDLGTHESEWNGEKKTLRKLVFTFEFPTETIEIDGVEKPMALSKEFTFSLNEKSTLYSFITSRFGKDVIKDGSLKSMNELLGKAAMVNVTNYTKVDGSQGAKIVSLNPTVKGIAIPEVFNQVVSLSLEEGEFNEQALNSLPEWIREKVKKSPEYDKLNEDLPF